MFLSPLYAVLPDRRLEKVMALSVREIIGSESPVVTQMGPKCGSNREWGLGGIGGTVAGAFIIGILSNGLNLMGISSYYQQVIKGIVFILAVVLDLFTK